MAMQNCLICYKRFYAKPSHINMGWGKFCSKTCQYESQKTGKITLCHTCKAKVYKTMSDQLKTNSGKLFCSKSCQTIWRNKKFSGDKHSNWAGGISSYRIALTRSSKAFQCAKCNLKDKRVLAVHHLDKNRSNNKLSNLIWLCHNCHYLVHHSKKEAIGFMVLVA